MRPRRSLHAVVLALLLVAAVAAAPAVADAPSKVAVSGAITLVSNQDLSSRTLGQNTLVRSVAEVSFGGDMTGPATEHYQSLFLANGTILQRGTGSFSGDVDGRTGTLEYVFHGDAATGGVITIIGGTGDLGGAHGRIAYGSASGSPPAFPYEGTVTLP
jgi:hypothetical protein